jgi:hypothetical protein
MQGEHFGLMDGQGRLAIPPLYDHVRIDLPAVSSYPIIWCTGYDEGYEKTYCKYSPDGKPLFGQVELPYQPHWLIEDINPWPGQLIMIQPSNFIDFDPLSGIPYPNLLERIHFLDAGHPRTGFRDIYGRRYF